MDNNLNPVILKCHCEINIIVKVATTKTNLGRDFFSCPFFNFSNFFKRYIYNCNFFIWDDKAKELGLFNGEIDQDMWNTKLSDKVDGLKNKNDG